MNPLSWFASSNEARKAAKSTVAQRSSKIPLIPATSIISISSSSSTVSAQFEDDFQLQTRLEPLITKSVSAKKAPTPSPLVKTLIDNLGSDLSEIIRCKDESIENLITKFEAEKKDRLIADNRHLVEKSHLLRIAGHDNAKSAARVLELHIKIKELEGENQDLGSKFKSKAFQLKKDIIDLKAWKKDAEGIVADLEREKREAKAEFEADLAAKDHQLEETKLKSHDDGKELEAKEKKIKELSKETSKLNRENNELLREVQVWKARFGGYKRTWEDFKEDMDEKLWVDEHDEKKVAQAEH